MGRLVLVSFLFSMVFLASPLGADTITIAADNWMPYNGDGKTETGYMVDCAREIFAKAGHTIVYEVVPWSRAIEEARSGVYNGIIGAAEGDAPDFVFPAVELGFAGQGFLTRKSLAWKYDGIKSLAGIKLAVIQDYSYFPELDEYIKVNKNDKKRIDFGFGTNPLESNLKKLAEGQVDALVDNSYVLKYVVAKLKLQDKVSSGGGVPPDRLYIAFSPANPKSKTYAKILSDGIEQLRRSGRLKEILAKYGLVDWK
jgi:polar amino acid transport system substrate-binding protein